MCVGGLAVAGMLHFHRGEHNLRAVRNISLERRCNGEPELQVVTKGFGKAARERGLRLGGWWILGESFRLNWQ